MRSLVDTHCHLDLEHFDADRAEVIQRALRAGVHAMVLIAYNPERWESTARLCEEHPFLTRAVGIHPNDASIWSEDIRCKLRDEIQRERPLGIGEIGIDVYRSADNIAQQREAFVAQLAIAAEFNLPVVIHQRSAEEFVLDVLNDMRPTACVMHCFSGGRDYAERCLDLGLFLGIGGVITFPKSDAIREALADVPLDRILLETDAPFLAPQVRRGKRNESSLLPAVVGELSKIMQLPQETIAEETTRNAVTLFGVDVSHAINLGLDAV